ncbi:hypothetical protein AAF712_012715 [Marasmius tenuissimus]|uniref:AAA-ATPase-like domain-containing protein n=1 Tax=Marasmius tenuissimus TaxID=585030 RepID=A0ABR2ZFP8_9AGAR
MSPVQRNPADSLHPHVSSYPGAADLTIPEGQYMNHPTDFGVKPFVDNDSESDDISKTIDYTPSLPPRSSLPRPVLSVVYPPYSKQTVHERLNELSSTSTNFKEIRRIEDNFPYTEAINGQWRQNSCWVLELDFGGLDVEAENFDMNDVINEGLRRFVVKYHFLESIDKRWEELKATVAAKTFDNILDAIMDGKHTIVVLIDNYDSAYWAVDESAFNSQESYEKFKARFDSALSRFFDRPVASWTGLRQISYTFLAGEEQILSMVSEQLFHLTRDVIVQEQSHGLLADEWADEFLGSQEAKDELESGYGFYRLSYRTVRNFFSRKLGEKIKDLPDTTPQLKIPVAV